MYSNRVMCFSELVVKLYAQEEPFAAILSECSSQRHTIKLFQPVKGKIVRKIILRLATNY